MKSEKEIQTAIDNAEQTLSFAKEVGGLDDSRVEKFTTIIDTLKRVIEEDKLKYEQEVSTWQWEAEYEQYWPDM